MKVVEYIDGEGWKRRSLVKDNMRPEQASQGIPRNPPDLAQLNCEDILRDLNNLLVDRGLFTIADLNKNPNLLRSTVLGAIQFQVLYTISCKSKRGIWGFCKIYCRIKLITIAHK